MATKPLRTSGKKKQPAAVETSVSIEDQVQAFLKAGGQIEKISSGVSGQSNMPTQKPKVEEAKPKTEADNESQ